MKHGFLKIRENLQKVEVIVAANFATEHPDVAMEVRGLVQDALQETYELDPPRRLVKNEYKEWLDAYLGQIAGKPNGITLLFLGAFADYLDRETQPIQPDQRPTPAPPSRM
jgi:hypothetical protein